MELGLYCSRSMLLSVAIACAMVMSMCSGVVEGDCTVQNNSGKGVIIVPVEVSVNIEVDVGVSVQVPSSQQHCYFKNAASGHQVGPVTLTDGTVYVIVDGAVSGTVDLYVGAGVDLLGIIKLGVKILVSI